MENMPASVERTPEQRAREGIYFNLRMALPKESVELTEVIGGGLMWIHYTDYANNYDMPMLIEQGFIEAVPQFVYKLQSNWQDRFPPSAYRLTGKGMWVCRYPGAYIIDGSEGD